MNLLVVNNKLATASFVLSRISPVAHAIKHIDFTWLATNSGDTNPLVQFKF